MAVETKTFGWFTAGSFEPTRGAQRKTMDVAMACALPRCIIDIVVFGWISFVTAPSM